MTNPHIKRFYKGTYLGSIELNGTELSRVTINVNQNTEEVKKAVLEKLSNAENRTYTADDIPDTSVKNSIGRIILDQSYENVLTNIRVKEAYRGNSYSREMIQLWLEWCFDEQKYSEAFIVNVNYPDLLTHG